MAVSGIDLALRASQNALRLVCSIASPVRLQEEIARRRVLDAMEKASRSSPVRASQSVSFSSPHYQQQPSQEQQQHRARSITPLPSPTHPMAAIEVASLSLPQRRSPARAVLAVTEPQHKNDEHDAAVVLACARDVADIHHDLVREREFATAKLERCAELEQRLEFLAERLTQRECELMMREARLVVSDPAQNLPAADHNHHNHPHQHHDMEAPLQTHDDPTMSSLRRLAAISSSSTAGFSPIPPSIFGAAAPPPSLFFPAAENRAAGSPSRRLQPSDSSFCNADASSNGRSNWDTAERCRDELKNLRDLISVEHVEQRLRASQREQMLLQNIFRLSSRVASRRKPRTAPLVSPAPDGEEQEQHYVRSPNRALPTPSFLDEDEESVLGRCGDTASGYHHPRQPQHIDHGLQTSPRLYERRGASPTEQRRQSGRAHSPQPPAPEKFFAERHDPLSLPLPPLSSSSLVQTRITARPAPAEYAQQATVELRHRPSRPLTNAHYYRKEQQQQQHHGEFESALNLSNRYENYEPSPPHTNRRQQQQLAHLTSPPGPLVTVGSTAAAAASAEFAAASSPHRTSSNNQNQSRPHGHNTMREAATDVMSPPSSSINTVRYLAPNSNAAIADEQARVEEEAYNERWILSTTDSFRKGGIIESICLLTDLISGRSWYCSVFLLRRGAVPHLPDLQLPSCVRCTLFVEDVIDASLVHDEFAVTVKMRAPRTQQALNPSSHASLNDAPALLLSEQLEASPARLGKGRNYAGVPCSIARALGEQHLKIECETRVEARMWLELFALAILEQKVAASKNSSRSGSNAK